MQSFSVTTFWHTLQKGLQATVVITDEEEEEDEVVGMLLSDFERIFFLVLFLTVDGNSARLMQKAAKEKRDRVKRD